MLQTRIKETFETLCATAPTEAESEAPALVTGVQQTDYPTKGYHLEVTLSPKQIVAATEILDREGFFIEAITGVDLLTFNQPTKKKPAPKVEEGAEAPPEEPEEKPGPPQMEVVYDFNHFDENCRVVLRSKIPRDTPEIPTISGIYPGANWHERETHDFFGIKFIGHPDLSPLLLPEDADFHPLLKDFSQ